MRRRFPTAHRRICCGFGNGTFAGRTGIATSRRCSFRRARGCRCGSPTTTLRQIQQPHDPPQRVRSGPRSTDEMGQLWIEVVPRRAEDAARLNADFVRRSLSAAIASAELDVGLDPRVAAAHNILATRYLQVGRVADAQAQLEEAVRLDPRDAEAQATSERCCRRRETRRGDAASSHGRASEAEGRLCALQSRGGPARGGAAGRSDARVQGGDRAQSGKRGRTSTWE